MATLDNLIITEDFTDETKLLFPATPWTIITDETTKKLVSPVIGHSSSTSLSFTINCSHLEIDYKVSSEKNYDKLYIYVDNSLKVTASGTSMSTYTTYKLDLTYGSHTVKFMYSKDSSNSVGLDRGEVWAIRYTVQTSENKYLFSDGASVKTVSSKVTDLSELTELTTLGAYPMNNVAYFANSGMTLDTVNYVLKNKKNLLTNTNSKVLVYNDLPPCIPSAVAMKLRSNPFGQIVEMNEDITFREPEVSHISKCHINATVGTSAILKFVFSKDGGTTWLAYNGVGWVTVEKTVSAITSNGMTLEVCNALTEEQLTLISDTKQIKVAWVMKRVDNDNVLINQIKFEYV